MNTWVIDKPPARDAHDLDNDDILDVLDQIGRQEDSGDDGGAA